MIGRHRRVPPDGAIEWAAAAPALGPRVWHERGEATGDQRLRTAASWAPSDAAGASGDWHDVITLPDGNVALITGDVAGHGTRAATLKVVLQDTVRRLAVRGIPPSELMTRLRALLAVDERYATLAYTIVCTARGVVTLANAGHPPPLLVSSDGSTHFVGGHPEPPLGVPWHDGGQPVLVTALLRPLDTLVLYTDGMIEGRGFDIGEGLARLAAAARLLAGQPPEEICEGLVSVRLARGRLDDDLTVLAVRLEDPRHNEMGAGARGQRMLAAG